MPNQEAPPGAIFVCHACGKVSSNRYGIDATEMSAGWDESCMLNAVLCDAASIVRGQNGRVVKAEAWKEKP